MAGVLPSYHQRPESRQAMEVTGSEDTLLYHGTTGRKIPNTTRDSMTLATTLQRIVTDLSWAKS